MAPAPKRKSRPATIKTMAYHRGLSIHKARHGGWYVTLTGSPCSGVLYATHQWPKISLFIKARPLLIRRREP
jgi:hypothetical protein